MERVCFQIQVRADRVAEYRERHAAIWPEMLAVLRVAGRTNSSLFLRPDGPVIGCLERESFEAARAAIDATDVNARWQAQMTPLLEHELTSERLEEVSHLD